MQVPDDFMLSKKVVLPKAQSEKETEGTWVFAR